jgi:hypothetical protein
VRSGVSLLCTTYWTFFLHDYLLDFFFTRLLTGLVVEREEEGARSARRNEVVGHHDVYRYGPEDEMP